MANFIMMLLCGLIGAIFGPVGFWVGIGVGLVVWIGVIGDKAKVKAIQERTRPQPPSPVASDHRHKSESSSATLNQGVSSPPASMSAPEPTGPQDDPAREYTASTVEFYAIMLAFYPSSHGEKVKTIADLLRGDSWIVDKFQALDDVAVLLPKLQTEGRDSPMIFQLRLSALIERLARLKPPMRMHLRDRLDGLVNSSIGTDSKECGEFIQDVFQALRVIDTPSVIPAPRLAQPGASEQSIVEDFILRSGDKKAISTLQEMRQDPSRYKEILRSGSAGNTVLRTGLGVFAGILAADAVKAAVTDYQRQGLLSQVDHEIAKEGGLEAIRFPIQNSEFNPSFAGATGGYTVSNFESVGPQSPTAVPYNMNVGVAEEVELDTSDASEMRPMPDSEDVDFGNDNTWDFDG